MNIDQNELEKNPILYTGRIFVFLLQLPMKLF